MSVLPSSAAHMSSVIRSGAFENETFEKFFECWLVEQDHYLQELLTVSRAPQEQQTPPQIKTLVDKVVRHYEDYYKSKAKWTKQDVISMLTPSWRSSLEDAFLWIGGWRPNMAFHLIYSKSGLQLEAQLERQSAMIRGLGTGNLAELSPAQLSSLDELQKKTIQEEKDISEKMAKHQESVADTEMVQLSNVVSELMRENGTNTGASFEEQRVKEALSVKEDGLEKMVKRADGLRLRTLKAVIDVLTPIQRIHFLITAAELHLRIHEWGKKRDAADHVKHDHRKLE